MGKHRECGEEKKCKRGHRGEPGKQGPPGNDGIQGIQGIQGQNGQNGQNGSQGIPGRDGQTICVPFPCGTPCGGCDKPCNTENKCLKIQCNPTDIYVGQGVGYDFETIQGAIDSLKGRRLCPCTIHVAAGDYTEHIHIDEIDAASNNQQRSLPSASDPTGDSYPTLWRGLQIVGDDRRFNNATYINGYAFAGNSEVPVVYTFSGTLNGSTPFSYNVLISSGFGITPPPSGVSAATAVVCNPILATTPILNGPALNNTIVLCKRGSNGFADKAANILAAAPSAKAVVIINDDSTPTLEPGGSNPAALIPTFAMSQADGAALLAATSITNVTIVLATPLLNYFPPTGTNYGLVTITQMGPKSLYVTLDATCVQADANIYPNTPVSENPSFGPLDTTNPLTTLGLVVGDRVMLSQNSLSDVFDPTNVAGSYFGYGQRQILTIAGFGASAGSPLNNQLFFNETISFDITTGVSLTLLPNVRIIGQNTYSWNTCDSTTVNTEIVNNVMLINNTGISLQGLWLDVNPTLPFSTFYDCLRIVNSEVQFSNVIVTDSGSYVVEPLNTSPPTNAVVFQPLSANGYGVNVVGSTINGNNGQSGDVYNNASITVIGWSSGVNLLNSCLNIDNLQVLGVTESGVTALASNIETDNIQILGCYGIYEPGAWGMQLVGSTCCNFYIALFSDILGSGVWLNQNASFNNDTPAVRVQNTVTGVASQSGPLTFSSSAYSYQAGVSVSSGSEFVIEQGIYLSTSDGTSLTTTLYNQPTLTAYIIDNTSALYGLPPLLTDAVLVFRGGSFIADCCVYFYNNDDDIDARPGSTVSIANPSHFGMPPSTLPMGCGCVPPTTAPTTTVAS